MTLGTEYWLPKPPTQAEAVYVAKNLFYKPDGCRDLHKNNVDCWSMLIVDGPDELIGQEITWFNRKPDDATDASRSRRRYGAPLQHLWSNFSEPELTIFDINPGLLEHPEFTQGLNLALQTQDRSSNGKSSS